MTVTSGKAWRRDYEEGVELTFPSGNVASIRPISVDLLFILGKIPDGLTSIVMKALTSGEGFNFDLSDPESYRLYRQLLDGVAEAAFVNPRIVKEPVADDEVMVNAIDVQDKDFLMQFFNQPASALHTFREQQKRDVESMAVEPEHAPAPVRPAEPEPVGG